MNCRFSNCDVPRANFTGTSLTNTTFSNTDTENALGLNASSSSSGGVSTAFQNNGSVTVHSGSTNFGTVVGSVGGSVVASNGGSVQLTSSGISRMPFDPWVRIFRGEPTYRIEAPGVNIEVTGTYTFENEGRFIHIAPTPFGILNVNIGTVTSAGYKESCSWELTEAEWCEIFPENFTLDLDAEEQVEDTEVEISQPNPSSFGGSKYGSGIFHREIT